MKKTTLLFSLALALQFFGGCLQGQTKMDKPNVIVVITDDQGYGDLGCHGNPIVKTPALDAFYKESVRLTDFHVGPTCAPTRAGLLTGRYANRTGVWHTIGGCSILRKEEVTVADVFADNGYETALFGKWHLGDSYPARPQDKGFKHVVAHGGGGVGQTNDVWNNDYFDDTYLVNGKPKKFEGYCTDVWFDEAIDFIKNEKENPFFCYISTNAPHSPFNVPLEYYEPYKDLDIPEFQKRFYGMITNVDDNFKRLQQELRLLNLDKNTILIFMTDNGTSAGYKKEKGKLYGYNAGMKGTKNSEYEGGHRVPFFISYPNGKVEGGRDISELTANVDILPTLTSLCGLELPKRDLDGTDISSLMKDEKKKLNRKYLITDSQRMQEPVKWNKSAVMSDKWRLVNGKELYNLTTDPGQEKDLAEVNPTKVKTLRGYYDEWWKSVSTQFSSYPIIILGDEKQNPTEFTCHDSHVVSSVIPWHQNHVRDGKKNPFGGEYIVAFAESGEYEITLSRWPLESDLAINAGLEKGRDAAINYDAISPGKAFDFVKGGVKIGGWKQEMKVGKEAKSLVFRGYFPEGQANLRAWFTTAAKEDWGAFYLKVEKI